MVSPLTASAAKTINDKQVSPPPVAWITMTGVSTTPAMQSAAVLEAETEGGRGAAAFVVFVAKR